jgi:pimeloyl-ACP methyl ester carboxylesterase
MTEQLIAATGKTRGLEHATFSLSAGTFHALEAPGAGRPLLFLHGFPDHPPTARAFFAELSRRGHRVLAPWLRGYAPSPVPDGPYDVASLTGDIVELIERWSPAAPVDVVGHDWGAVITYALCQAAPARVARAVTLAIPHPLTFLHQLRSPAQLRASWYMGLFQLPGSERVVRARDYRLIDRLWRRWSPGLQLPDDERRALRDCLEASELAPLEYYRAMRRVTRAELKRGGQPIATPLLALHGAQDGCVLPPAIDDRKRFSGPYERRIVGGVGHFMHVEQPAQIAELVGAWLRA